MKKFSKILLGVFIFIAMIFIVSSPVNADSGWDSDYGGSSSWDSGGSSSWDSGGSSSWDHDYGSSSSSSSGSSSSSSPIVSSIIVLIYISVILYVISSAVLSNIRSSTRRRKNRRDGIGDKLNKHAGLWASEHVGDFIPGYDKDKLLSELYQNFIDVQNAWMEFDYDALKRLCTDELYESYKSDLEILKAQNGKNIMNNFRLVNSRIIDIKEENEKVIITIFLEVKFHDYVIDVDTNKVTRGNKNTVMDNRYNLVFVTSKSDTGICPNCGAKIESRDCSYCGSHIDSLDKGFVLSNKSRIR